MALTIIYQKQLTGLPLPAQGLLPEGKVLKLGIVNWPTYPVLAKVREP